MGAGGPSSSVLGAPPAPPTPQPSLLPWTPATPGEATGPHPPPLWEDATAQLRGLQCSGQPCPRPCPGTTRAGGLAPSLPGQGSRTQTCTRGVGSPPVGTGAPRPGSQGRASQGLPRTSLPRGLWPDPQGDQIDQQTAKAKASLPPCSSRKQPGPPSRPGGYPEPTPRGSRARGDQEDGGGAGGGRTPSGCGAHEQRAGLSLPGHLPAP